MTDLHSTGSGISKPDASLKKASAVSIYIITLGLTTAVLSLGLGIIYASADYLESDMKEHSTQFGSLIAASGVAYLAACIASISIWRSKKHWAKHLILVVMILGTLSMGFILYSISWLVSCGGDAFLILLLADIAVIIMVYGSSPTINDE